MTRLTASQIAELCRAELHGDGTREFTGPASLEDAGPAEIGFLADPRYTPRFEASRAGCVLVSRTFETARDDVVLLRVDEPSRAFSAVIEAFATPPEPRPAGVHPSAVVEDGVELGTGVSVGALAVVEAGAVLGDGAVIHPHVVVGRGARVGERTVLHAGVVLYPGVRVGADCIVHAGVVLGSDGFGFEPGPAGLEKVPQCGTAELGDRVEVGANTVVDRARFGTTRIGSGSKLDNLVQIGHNVVVGEHSILCGQVGISGSTRVGSGVVIAGQAGLNGHIEVGDGARIAGGAAVYGDVEAGADVSGRPARPHREELRRLAEARRVPKRVAGLEERVGKLEGSS